MNLPSRRQPWIAALLSLLHAGLGQLYLGQGRRAVLIFVTFPVVHALATGLALAAPSATMVAVLGALAVVVPVQVGSLLLAFFDGRKTVPEKKYRTWKVIVPVFFLLTVVEEVSTFLVRTHWLEPFVSPTGSMEPTILPGDRFYVDKRYGRTRPLSAGDIVVFTRPEEPGVRYVKRIRDVSEDSVFVVGDNPENSFDSRSYGPVPKQRLEGKPTQVWFSFDGVARRIRWERLGLMLR